MGGCIASESDYGEICQALEAFIHKEFPEIRGLAGFRLHASYMYNARDVFSGMNAAELRGKVTRFYRLINGLPIQLVATAIHKEKLVAKYPLPQDPYNLAFLYTCERFQRHLAERTKTVGQPVLESRGPGLDKLYRSKLESFLSMGTKWTSLPLVAKPEFKTCIERPPLQVADFVCYAIHKSLNKSEPQLFNSIKSKFRQNQRGVIDGFGLIIYPK